MRAVQTRLSSQIFRNISMFRTKIRRNPSMALQEAESLTGYSTSMRQKWLDDEHIRMIDILMGMYFGPNVNFLQDMKKFLLDNYHLPWGLIILLVSKTAEPDNQLKISETNPEVANIQQSIAEVGDMLRSMKIIHNKVQNLPSRKDQDNLEIINNKLFLLIGDYLIGKVFHIFSTWKRNSASELISSAVRDSSDISFMEPKDSYNRFIPAKPVKSSEYVAVTVPNMSDINTLVNFSKYFGIAKKEWILRHLLGSTIIVSKCCQAVLLVGNHPETLQISGHLLGSYLVLAHKASADYSEFLVEDKTPFDFINAPLMFHLQDNPDYYEHLLEVTKHQSVDYEEIKKEVRRGDGLNKTKGLVNELASKAMDYLKDFPDNDAKMVLRNIIKEF